MPPLTISRSELERLVEIVAESIRAACAASYPARAELRAAA